MDFYNNLNEMILYIENNLYEEIDYQKLAKMVGVNISTLQRLFPLISGVTLTEYIRKRRLTLAGKDLVQSKMKVIDVALKYGYTNATTFSRAFTKFHGIKPAEVKKTSKLIYYPKLEFTIPIIEEELQYEVIEMESFAIYGLGIKTDNARIKKEAPLLFTKVKKDYPMPDYGMIVYQDRFNSDQYEYWVLWKNKYPNMTEIKFPKSRWLKFRINSQEAKDIQEMSDRFYLKFLPTCMYSLKELPELEYYHSDEEITDFLIPIN